MRRSVPILVLALVVAYLGLALFATACAVDHFEGAPAHHHPHHGSGISHSSFCAWACQANPTSSGFMETVASEPILVSTAVAQQDRSVEPGHFVSLRASRAPPARF